MTKARAFILGLVCAWPGLGFGASETLRPAALSVRFDEAKWRVTARDEKRGADLILLSLLNDSEGKSFSIITPRVGKRVGSLSELADRFALFVDDSPAPKRSKVELLGREAILLCGTTVRPNANDNRNRAIIVFFAGGDEWGIVFSCPAKTNPGIQDILGLVGPLK